MFDFPVKEEAKELESKNSSFVDPGLPLAMAGRAVIPPPKKQESEKDEEEAIAVGAGLEVADEAEEEESSEKSQSMSMDDEDEMDEELNAGFFAFSSRIGELSDNEYTQLQDSLNGVGQGHLLAYFDELDQDERAMLL